ncbi:hypothetical protein LCGC14_3110340, partial [marine sediment metagenome]
MQEVGGVGYYPTSGIPFVHVDTGRVRMWPRIPRLDLAALFPSGKTCYLPTDAAKPKRLQGVFVSDKEIERLVEFWTQDRFQEVDREVFDHLLE